jgi:hypothetical protein
LPQVWAIEKFRLAPFVVTHTIRWQSKFFGRLGKKVRHEIKFFSKMITQACTPFSCHLTMGVCWMVIEIFWSPKGGVCVPPLLGGDRKFLIAIQHTNTIKWRPNVFGHHLTHSHHWMAIKKI